MGMSASQARLLSITSRLSDNELRSQTISTAKSALANKTNQASAEYLAALDETNMFFSTYDTAGNKVQTALTGACLTQYAPLKNQYAIVNSDGQAMVAEIDAHNYLASATLGEFLEKYGVATVEDVEVDNPKYIDKAIYIYGSDWQSWITNGTGSVGGLMALEPQQPDFNMIEWVENTTPNNELYEQFIEAVTKSSCWYGEPASSDSDKVYHFTHILNHLLDYDADFTAYPGEAGEVTYHKPPLNNNAAGSVDGQYAGNWSADSETIAEELRHKLNGSENNDETLVQDIINLVYDCTRWNIINKSGSCIPEASTLFPDNGQPVKSNQELADRMQDIMNRLKQMKTEKTPEWVPDVPAYEAAHAEWQVKLDKALEELNALDRYLTDDQIDVTDADQATWYINLWHRMNGASNYKAEIDGVENGAKPAKHYLGQDEEDDLYAGISNNLVNGLTENGKILWTVWEDGLMNSADYLKHAIKNNLVTIERVNFTEPTVDGSGLEQATWTSIIYTNALDISETENEKVITMAEVKYKQALSDIEAKDKQYDNMIRRLDTEHNALRTEYESIKGVITKNIERTLKMYS